jgi:hypothetical protein
MYDKVFELALEKRDANLLADCFAFREMILFIYIGQHPF